MTVETLHQQSPLVSVIMPAYCAQQYIADAIRSVQNQTVTQWELIVVDDCSDDETARIVAEMSQADSRIQLIRNDLNLGVAGSRNRGVELCRGEYVAFLDSDDRWHPEKLYLQLDCFRCRGVDLVYTDYSISDEAGRILRQNTQIPESVQFVDLLKENVIGCSTVMISREVARKFRFPRNIYHEDYALWLDMLRSGCKAVGVQRVLMQYCYRENSKSGNKWKSASARWHIYRRYLGLPIIKSAWLFGHYALAGLRKYIIMK